MKVFENNKKKKRNFLKFSFEVKNNYIWFSGAPWISMPSLPECEHGGSSATVPILLKISRVLLLVSLFGNFHLLYLVEGSQSFVTMQ